MNTYFNSPHKILNKSVLYVLIVFGLSFVFLTLKYEVAFAWGDRRAKQEDKIFSLIQHNKLQEAMTATDEYLNKYKKKDDGLMWGYNAKGVIFSEMHEYTKAIYAYQESIKKLKLLNLRVGYKDNMRILLGSIGDLQQNLGDYTDAILYYEEGIQVMDSYDPKRYMTKMYIAWSKFYLSQGMDTNSLKQVYEETKPKLREIENSLNQYEKGNAYSMASEIAFQLGRFDEVLQFNKTMLKIHNTASNLYNIDSDRLYLAIVLLYLKREVEANEAFRNVLWRNVRKDSLASWHWLKGDETLARRCLKEYFAEECTSDIARENLRGSLRRSKILPYDMWKEARKKKWFIELVSPNTLDFSTEEYTEKPEHETQEEIRTYSIENQEKDSTATVFTTNVSNVFHKRDCSKLNASEGLIKFDTPQKAGKAGCLPCNYCKP